MTGSVSGKRTVTVSSLVTVPSGYELRWYSGPNLSPNPATGDATTAMTPGTPYTTNGSMPVGVACHNMLFWYDIARNAWQRAHPAGDIISFTIQGIEGEPGEPADPTFTPNVTVATVAAVRAQFNTWNASTKTADFVCGINANTSGTFDLTGLQNTSAFRFWVRHVGTFTDYQCSVRHSGAIRLDSSRGVYATRMHVVTGQSEGVTMTGAVQCGYDRCLLEVSRLGDGEGSGAVNPHSSFPWAINTCRIRDNTDCRFSNNLIRFGLKASVIIERCTNLRFFGNMTSWFATDDIKVWDRADGLIFERNWGGRKSSTAPGQAPHHDWFQHQGENLHNSRFWGNVCLSGRNAWWFGPAGLGQQGFFHRPDAQNLKGKTLFISNTTWEQNIIAIDNGSIKFAGAPETSQTNCSASNNTLLTVWVANAFALSAVQSNARNFIAGGNEPGQTQGIGTNGVGIAIGKGDYTDSQGVFHPAVRNYSPLANWFTHGIPLQNSGGTMANPPQPIKCIHPKAGTRLGLDNTGITLGAHIRSREIFDETFRTAQSAAAGYKVLPADCGWPVAGTWHDDYNYDDYVESTYTGSYDSNGDNA
jgi:hypothetical protein